MVFCQHLILNGDFLQDAVCNNVYFLEKFVGIFNMICSCSCRYILHHGISRNIFGYLCWCSFLFLLIIPLSLFNRFYQVEVVLVHAPTIKIHYDQNQMVFTFIFLSYRKDWQFSLPWISLYVTNLRFSTKIFSLLRLFMFLYYLCLREFLNVKANLLFGPKE